ncbi:hypothetical protein L211DRAFT_840602 [Terfezia boudieri ATCC MYA-4762]|uniref:MFS general substrate transporter n=1 Tax=Terfezia boudieri ATCC MYA-4762 TaxID=1051890 RepID=A0A3N4LFB2_9PEZI|nr:hypothetical protein L211DRAFT_840602 [Terfezia boudieri ATCC MYA-4762]
MIPSCITDCKLYQGGVSKVPYPSISPSHPKSPIPSPPPVPHGQGAEAISEKELVRKHDRNIIPLVMTLYLFSFLDRVNISNARLYGLEEDLGLIGVQFQVAVSMLFVTYIIFEIPSNLVLKKFHPGSNVYGSGEGL